MPEPYVDSDANVLLWFRTDLRLRDHPGVVEALASGRPVIPLFILDDTLYSRPLGAASRWWLHRSLKALDKDLRAHGSRLIIQSGDSQRILTSFVEVNNIKTIIYSHSFDPKAEHFDNALDLGTYVDFRRHNSTLELNLHGYAIKTACARR